jgi:hypothetical protein
LQSIIKRVAVCLFSVVAGLAAMATPASASDACAISNGVCLYQNTNYPTPSSSAGRRVEGTATNYSYHDGDTFHNGVALFDRVSSLQLRRSGWYFTLWTDHFLRGCHISFRPLENPANLGAFSTGCSGANAGSWNDKGSSHHWF